MMPSSHALTIKLLKKSVLSKNKTGSFHIDVRTTNFDSPIHHLLSISSIPTHQHTDWDDIFEKSRVKLRQLAFGELLGSLLIPSFDSSPHLISKIHFVLLANIQKNLHYSGIFQSHWLWPENRELKCFFVSWNFKKKFDKNKDFNRSRIF